MKLIAILIALTALKYLTYNSVRYNWFIKYSEKIQNTLAGFNSSWLGYIIIMAPILFIVFFLQQLTEHWLRGLVGFIIDVILLWYCLWPQSIHNFLEDKLLKKSKQATTIGSAEDSRMISQQLLVAANQQMFAVLFWFFIFGGFGALIYRMTTLLHAHSQTKNSALHEIARSTDCLQTLLDWLPARLTALTYVVAGNFIPAFEEWRKNIWSGFLANNLILIRTGIAACGFNNESNKYSDQEENRSLVRLIERALAVWISIAIILTLGKWFY